ncbi:transketolase family protein [Granulicella sp. WH15]|uniref:transketolase family protein n=1 Tax=Granulicella sp. WH15 TaxID=2602070 RepID=UPI0013678C19|nr:transketolase family protein [Granulicella sp. WH15]QHN03024.1 transketolase family protein [Granulicella sp. WH15]
MSAEATVQAGLFDCRDSFAATMEAMAAADPRIAAVVNDSVSSTKLKGFRSKFPERFVNVGIAEQNMVGVGAGLANGGMIPFVCGASCFLTARAMEQVKVDLGYARNNVKLCGMSSGMAYGELGPTHHSIEDLAWTRVIPNLTVIVPVDPVETKAALLWARDYVGPVFLRLSRLPVPVLLPEDYVFTPGRAVPMREGTDITIVANGVLVCRALEAAEKLAQRGISARVLNASSMAPIDREAIIKAAKETRGIVTVEEASIYGGLGGAVAEILALEHPTRMKILGVPGVFAPTGSAEFLLEHFGLTAAGIETAAVELLNGVAAG